MPGLDGDEEILWRSLVELLLRLPRVLDENFEREAKVSMTDYAVLVALSEAPAGELRMGELAEATALSRSRTSRVVDDLVRRSLVTRRKCEQDGRSSLAAVAPEGMAVLAEERDAHDDTGADPGSGRAPRDHRQRLTEQIGQPACMA